MNNQALVAEINHRFGIYNRLKAASTNGDGMRLPAKLINDEKAFYGGRGIWRDATRTSKITEDNYGLTVGVLHTGASYDDDMDDDGGLYHYPVTKQSSTDDNEVESMKNCMRFGVPIIAITKPSINSKLRNVHLAWVTSFDDEGKMFLIEYGEQKIEKVSKIETATPPQIVKKKKTRKTTVRARPGQAKFRYLVLASYGTKCLLSQCKVKEMLEAAHIIPEHIGGPDDPRNGLVLSANLHKAYDSSLWCIDPNTYDIVSKNSGPSLDAMGISIKNLSHVKELIWKEALIWRWERWDN